MDAAFTHLAQFSDWTLAILPRLFLYPGGLWMLFVFLWLRFTRGDKSELAPRALAPTLLQSDQLSVATAWVALALLPLPGTSPLPFPVDRFSLAGLLLTSLVLTKNKRSASILLASSSASKMLALPLIIAVLLAIMAPIAGSKALLPSRANLALSDWVSLAAILVGLCVLSTQSADLEGDLRWLAWLGLAASPLWALDVQASLPGVLWTSLFYAVSIAALVGASRLPIMGRIHGWLEVTCWGLAALSLLLSLLG